MRILLFSILFMIVSCGSKSDSKTTTTSEASTTTNSSAPSKGIQGDTDVEEPIMGGPADFTIKLTDSQSKATSRLVACYVDQNFVIDTAVMQNGVIRYQRESGYPQGLYFVSIPGNQYIQVILGEDQKFKMECPSKNFAYNMKVEGSVENELYYETTLWESKINPKIQIQAQRLKQFAKGTPEYNRAKDTRIKLAKEREDHLQNIANEHPKTLFSSFKIGGQNPTIDESLSQEQQVIKYRQDFWSMVDMSDRRLLQTPMIGNKLKRYMEELTVQHPDSIIASADYLVRKSESYPEFYKVFTNWITKKYEPTKTTLMDPEAVFVHMIQNYFTFERAFWQDSVQTIALQGRAHEMAQSLIGGDAPDVTSTDINGKTISLLDKTADYLVVYMFNPDCEHCQEQTPKLIDYYNKNKSEVDVMAIAIETEEKLWKDYAKKLNMPFSTVYDPTNRSIYAKYYVDITPELYVINPDRKIIGKNLKVFQIQQVIERDKEKR